MLARASSPRRSRPERKEDGLSARRRRTRRRALVALLIFSIIAGIAFVIGLWRPAVRISDIQVFGDSVEQSALRIVQRALEGTYIGIIPRDSIFFFPASRIREDILSMQPEIAAVSLFRNGLTGLSVKVSPRVPIASWCGSSNSVIPEPCYVFDSSGYIFAPHNFQATTTYKIITPFVLHAPLALDPREPLRASIARAEKLPAIFDFARKLAALGTPVERIILRGDEVDDILANGTRVTYVLGNELPAYSALTSAKADLDLTSDSLEYVDLRFDGKVYFKRKK